MEEKKKKFESKLGLDKFQYEYCSELIWGGIPVERDWAEDSKLFLEKYNDLLKDYDPQKEKEWKEKVKNLPNKKNEKLIKNSVFSNIKSFILTLWSIFHN